MQTDLHLPSGNIDVPCSVRVHTGKDGIGRGRCSQFLDFGAQGLDLSLGFLKRRDQFLVLFGGLVELVARLIQPTEFLLHRLDLNAELVDFTGMLVVSMDHVRISLGQSTRDVSNGISEGPKFAGTFFLLSHEGARGVASFLAISRSPVLSGFYHSFFSRSTGLQELAQCCEHITMVKKTSTRH